MTGTPVECYRVPHSAKGEHRTGIKREKDDVSVATVFNHNKREFTDGDS